MSEADETVASLVKRHRDRKERLRTATDRKWKEASAALHESSALLSEEVNRDASEVFTKQQVLEQQSRDLHKQADTFLKQSQRWIDLFHDFDRSLKELGDVGHWAQVIERDAKETVFALRTLHESRRQLRQTKEETPST
eukprot:TRINITY_DN35681_c0_g1_i1.p1 TRINITY_DN35681_c0_g1~~TRINITY_DN35681_c0_g1_i1.p1  ORF type:complete len:157 (+),score=63.70 TRINITY_DN35681_c0_g1_i1:57-473(+)